MTVDKQPQICYVPICTTEEMPPIGETVSVSFDGGVTFPYEAKGKGWTKEEVNYTHWLKKVDRILFTPAELEAMKAKWQREFKNRWIPVAELPSDFNTIATWVKFIFSDITGLSYTHSFTGTVTEAMNKSKGLSDWTHYCILPVYSLPQPPKD